MTIMKNIRGFASDNNSGVHKDILKAMKDVNMGHTIAYGSDIYTLAAIEKMKEVFGEDTDIYFVFTGTAANVLGLDAITQPYHSIICAESSHIYEDECGAPEKFTGCKLLAIPTENGKLTPDAIKKHLYGFDFEHHSQPRVISITQATELGTVYTPDEIKAIADLAHENKMLLHMDGARIANAAASLGLGFREFTGNVDVDILSFGGTKNGMMYGEAIVFFNKGLTENFKYIRKQGMQLASKMRFISAQFMRYLSDDLWLKNAAHANKMARLLETEVKDVPGLQITQKVEANGVFAILPKEIIPELQKEFFFYVWDEKKSEVRWMTSFDTKAKDVRKFARAIRDLLK
jgi:threonine aldolase